MKNSLLLLRAFAGLAGVIAMSAYAQTPTGLSPNEGTIGTMFTISGSGFGPKQGLVFIDQKPCAVLAWSDAAIQCQIKVPMPPGAYNLELKPHGGGDWVTLPQAFAIRPPMLYPTIPYPPGYLKRFVSPGDVITLNGNFFGDMGFLRVQIEDLQGKTRPCKVLNASMESITFQLPAGMSGVFDLRVSNLVGSAFLPSWGTFEQAELPPPPPGGDQMLSIETDDIAAGVFYHNRLWFFYPRGNEELAYMIFYNTNFTHSDAWSDEITLKSSDGNIQKSYATVAPVVVNDYLYVFYTGISGNVDYTIYNPMASDPALRWSPYENVPGAKLSDVNGVVAAVYNYTANRIELYWSSDSRNVYMKTCNPDTDEWSDPTTVNIQKAQDTITPHLSAVFNQLGTNDYVTYLSWDDGLRGYLGELKDGNVQRYVYNADWECYGERSGPSLADWGEGHLAVMYNHDGRTAEYVLYDTTSHGAVTSPTEIYHSYNPCGWSPNGLVASMKVSEDMANSYFYTIVGENPWYVAPNSWHVVQTAFVGQWRRTSTGEVVDWGSGQEMLTNSFPYWPILGIIDMAPFVGNGYEDACQAPGPQACSTAELSFALAKSTGMAGDASIGPYFETGKRSRISAEASAALTGGFETSTNFTYTTTGGIDANTEGAVVAYYLAPVFRIYDVQFYNLFLQPTDLHTTAIELVNINIRRERFVPDQGPPMASAVPYPYLDPTVFPMHAAEDDTERLLSYRVIDPGSFPCAFAGSATSALNSPGEFGWKISVDNTVDQGWYVTFKFGTEIAKRLGFGVEGEFSMRISTSTQADVEAQTVMVTSDPAPGFDDPITEFHVKGYWLKPDASGYWVPRNRQGLGDAPWLITYYVTDWWPY